MQTPKRGAGRRQLNSRQISCHSCLFRRHSCHFFDLCSGLTPESKTKENLSDILSPGSSSSPQGEGDLWGLQIPKTASCYFFQHFWGANPPLNFRRLRLRNLRPPLNWGRERAFCRPNRPFAGGSRASWDLCPSEPPVCLQMLFLYNVVLRTFYRSFFSSKEKTYYKFQMSLGFRMVFVSCFPFWVAVYQGSASAASAALGLYPCTFFHATRLKNHGEAGKNKIRENHTHPSLTPPNKKKKWSCVFYMNN